MTPRPEVVTFGCRLNSAESEKMQRYAEKAGLENTVIVNTCAVTAEAERQAGQAIRRLKRERPEVRIIVTGCASQIDKAKYADMPEVFAVIGNDEKLKPESFAALSGREVVLSAMPESADLDAMQRAFVQVQNGCDHRCTFCIIPFGRGASTSLPLDDVIAQTRAHVAGGFNEVVLTGVDIASYASEGLNFGGMAAQLLRAVPELKRLRLSSLDPAVIDDDLWRLLAEEPRLMPHWHLSLQAGDDMVLKRMKRRHLRADVIALCERARRLRPDIVFGADLIAGFPTETEGMAENTYNLVRDCGFTWLHVFPYSARKGTPAARMPQVPGQDRKSRADRLRALGDEAERRHLRGLIGKSVEILVEKKAIGCTPQFAKLPLLGTAAPGSLIQARIVEKDGTIYAEVE